MKTVQLSFLVSCCAALFFFSCAEETQQIHGCTDPNSVNYDSTANVDNNSCVTIPNKQNSIVFFVTDNHQANCGVTSVILDSLKGELPGKYLEVRLPFATDTFFNVLYTKPVYDSLAPIYQTFAPNAGGMNNHGITTQDPLDYVLEITDSSDEVPTAGVGLRYSVGAGANEGMLNINAYVKFFRPSSGKYRLALYVLHKSRPITQNIGGIDSVGYKQKHMLACAVNTPLGEYINTSGSIANGKIFKVDHTFAFPNTVNPHNTEVVGILWWFNPVSSKWQFVNCTVN